MGTFPLTRHLVVSGLVCLLALAAALFAFGAAPIAGQAASSAPRAAADGEGSSDERFPLDGPAITRAREISEQHWGAAPCKGEITVEWTTLASGTNATAKWRNPTSAWENPSQNFDCSIELNREARFTWEKLCSVMAHEIGHLLGRPHVDDADDLMAPYYSGALPVCADAPEPGRSQQPEPAPVADAPVAPAGGVAQARSARTKPTLEQRRAWARKAARERAMVARVKRRVARRLAARGRAKRCATGRRMMAWGGAGKSCRRFTLSRRG